MTATTTELEAEAARILAECCITLVGAGGTSERVALLAQAHELGIMRYDVVCDRCTSKPMTLGAFLTNHYARTEADHREAVRRSGELGDIPGAWSALNPGLHKPGDARIAYLGEVLTARPPVELEDGAHINPSGIQ